MAMISTIFESKNAGNISANVQFCFEHDAEAVYKYLLDDQFTRVVGQFLKVNGDKDPIIISIEEANRRHEYRERLIGPGEILKMPVSRYDPNYRFAPKDYQLKHRQNSSYNSRDIKLAPCSEISVYVSQIPKEASEKELGDVMQQFKPQCKVAYLPSSNAMFKSAIVYFNDVDAVSRALSCQTPLMCRGCRIKISRHKVTRK